MIALHLSSIIADNFEQMKNEWKKVADLAEEFDRLLGSPPGIAAVLGSGLGLVSEKMENVKSFETRRIPGVPVSTVEGHRGFVHLGTWGGRRVFIFEGRVHLYEGYNAREVVRPLRAAVLWGVKTVLLTNAAGGIHPSLAPGQLMIIDDQINLTGANPLRGPNDDLRGPRFPDMTELYDGRLRQIALEWGAKAGVDLGRGIYAGVLGPSYETPAEVRALGVLGASAVGMSTVLEALAAKHLGARVFGVSCITNRAAGLSDETLDHGEVKRMGRVATRHLAGLLETLVTTTKEEP